jgi:hypothetical protein
MNQESEGAGALTVDGGIWRQVGVDKTQMSGISAERGMCDSARNEKEKDPILVVFAYVWQRLVVSTHLSICQKGKESYGSR